MRKLLVLIVLISVLFLVLAGCGINEPSQVYKSALEKTEAIQQGKTKFTLDIDMEWNENETLNQVESGKFDVQQVELTSQFDKEQEINKTDLYFEANGFGMEAVIFNKSGKLIIKSPILPKLLVINKQDLKKNTTTNESSTENQKDIDRLWKELLKDKTVVSLGNIVLSTPDGEVKAKEYEVDLNGSDLQPVLLKTIDILSKDPMLEDAIINNNPQNANDFELDAFWENSKRWVESGKIGDISFKAYIDRDGYVVEETFNMSIDSSNKDTLQSMSINFNNRRWDINKPIDDIEVPRISNENSFNIIQQKSPTE